MEPKCTQNGAHIEQNGAKLETKCITNRIKHQFDLFVFLNVFVHFLLAKIMGGFSVLSKNARLVTIKAPQKIAQMEGKLKA